MSKKKNKSNNIPEISLAIPQIPKLFGEIIVKPQAELKKFCREYLKYKGYTVSSKDGFLYAKGNIPVMLVAHLDTVHNETVREIYISNMGNITSPQGIGGDDRCGVYAILDLISRTDYRPYILFAEDEEIGCVGSRKFAEKVDKYKPDVNFIIEIDRKGSNDAVYYDCENPEFEEFISSYGFETEWGSYSDIAEIAPVMGVAAVNLSSGYYKAHTTDEYISMTDLNNTINRVEQIVADVANGKTKKYEYIEAVYTSKYGSYYGKGLHSGWYNDYDYECAPYQYGFEDYYYDFEKPDITNSSVVCLGEIFVSPIDLSKASICIEDNDGNVAIVDEFSAEANDYYVDDLGNIYLYYIELNGLMDVKEAIAYTLEGRVLTMDDDNCESMLLYEMLPKNETEHKEETVTELVLNGVKV